MKTTLTYLICVLFTCNMFGQISIASNSGYSNGFNSYLGSLATIPAGITVTATQYRGVTNGTSNNGGARSYSTSAGDNSLGGLVNNMNSPIVYQLSFVNNTGTVINAMTISYDFEQYRYSNTSGIVVTGGGGLSSSNLSGLNQNGSSSGTNGVVTVTPKSITTSGLTIANGASFSISFTFTDITNSNNGIAIDNFNLSSLVLPIKLTSFNAKNVGTTNTLNWQTSSEINNSHFEILHSTDAKSYSAIGKEMGNGNTSENKSYSYEHQNVKSGTHYYQLRQVDYDGHSETFGPVSVTVEGNKLRFFPTVAENTIHFDGLLDNENYAIYSVDGKTFQTGKVTKQIDISNIPKGVYYIRYGNETSQLIKL